MFFSLIVFILSSSNSECQEKSLKLLGRDYLEQGRIRDAKRCFLQYNQQNPRDGDVLFYLYQLEEDGEKAANDLKRILALDAGGESHEKTLFELGLYYYAKGYYSSAANMFETALTQYPQGRKHDQVLFYYIFSLVVLGRDDKINELVQSINQSNEPAFLLPWIQFCQARALMMNQNYSASIQQCLNLLEQFPQFEYRSNVYLMLYENHHQIGAVNQSQGFYQKLKGEFGKSIAFNRLKIDYPVRTLESGEIYEYLDTLETELYTIQIGAFSGRGNAIALKDKYQEKIDDKKTLIVSKQQEAELLYLVWCGVFEDELSADVFAIQRFKKEKVSYQIVKMKIR